MDLKIKDNSKLKLALFTQLEYIESTGTQWIDTGISFPNGYRIVSRTSFPSVATNQQFSGTWDGSKMNMIIIRDGKWNPCIGGDYNYKYGTVIANTFYNIDISNANNKSIVVVDGNQLGNNTISGNSYSIGKISIFAVNNTNNSSHTFSNVKLGETKIYNANNELVLDFIPCITDLGIPGMYDTVSQTFFYNQGTGDFVAGPEVPSTITKLPDNISIKTTTLYHKNTPNVNGLQLLNGIFNAQETAEDVVLNRIRVDIGNVSGSLSELLQYAGMSGFDDNYEPQAKPRLVGTFTINDYYTSGQLTAAQAAFDGLTIVPDQNYLIDFNELAVQVLDPEQPNYNPAVAIILQGKNHGIKLSNPIVSGGGRWFLTKTQAAAITTFQRIDNDSIFRHISTVTDANGIVSYDTSATYDFEYFNELVYFTGFSEIYTHCFLGCTKLKEVDLSNHKLNMETFYGCTSLQKVVLNSNETQIPHKCFINCSRLEVINFPSTIGHIGESAFEKCGKNKDLDLNLPSLTGSTGARPFFCSSLIRKVINLGTLTTIVSFGFSRSSCTEVTLPATLTTMTGEIFAFCPNLVFVHLLSETPPSASSDCFKSTTTGYKIYVGDGSSAAHDDAILADYQAASGWSSYTSRLDTWYNYLHPQS